MTFHPPATTPGRLGGVRGCRMRSDAYSRADSPTSNSWETSKLAPLPPGPFMNRVWGEVLARGREALWDPLLRGVSSVFFWRRRGVDAGAHGWSEVPSTKVFCAAPRRRRPRFREGDAGSTGGVSPITPSVFCDPCPTTISRAATGGGTDYPVTASASRRRLPTTVSNSEVAWGHCCVQYPEAEVTRLGLPLQKQSMRSSA